jgi:hypothetical protein
MTLALTRTQVKKQELLWRGKTRKYRGRVIEEGRLSVQWGFGS